MVHTPILERHKGSGWSFTYLTCSCGAYFGLNDAWGKWHFQRHIEARDGTLSMLNQEAGT